MSVAYPTPGSTYPTVRSRPPSASTAESLVLAALVLQVIGAAVLIVGLSVALGVSVVTPFDYSWVAVIVAVVVGGIALLFLYLAYEYAYRRIRAGEYEAAQAPTLLIGSLSLFVGIVPGILYIVGYVKLGDAVREQRSTLTPAPAGPSAGTLPSGVGRRWRAAVAGGSTLLGSSRSALTADRRSALDRSEGARRPSSDGGPILRPGPAHRPGTVVGLGGEIPPSPPDPSRGGHVSRAAGRRRTARGSRPGEPRTRRMGRPSGGP